MPDSPSMQSLIFLYGPVLESSHGTISSISLITGLALFGWVEKWMNGKWKCFSYKKKTKEKKIIWFQEKMGVWSVTRAHQKPIRLLFYPSSNLFQQLNCIVLFLYSALCCFFFFFWQTYSPLCCCSANANFSWLPYWENVRLDYVLFISYFKFCLYFQ